MKERTLIILKPDCHAQNIFGAVLERFNGAGFRVVASKMMRLSRELLDKHYAHHADKPYFPEIVAFMQSAPVMVLVLEGEDVITQVRSLLGPTDPAEAPEGTIRKQWGSSKMCNVAHASDSPESAAIEIKRFFQSAEIVTS